MTVKIRNFGGKSEYQVVLHNKRGLLPFPPLPNHLPMYKVLIWPTDLPTIPIWQESRKSWIMNKTWNSLRGLASNFSTFSALGLQSFVCWKSSVAHRWPLKYFSTFKFWEKIVFVQRSSEKYHSKKQKSSIMSSEAIEHRSKLLLKRPPL